MTIVFKTSGLIPIEAFTTFGINSKPTTTTAIGFFGTGLKYAVAVLCRMRIPVEVWIGEKCYHFYPSSHTFRGKDFEFIRMKRRDGLLGKWFGHTRLPFTTELGKNWELWQAYRELHSNTLDELGQTAQVDDEEIVVGSPNHTHIVIRGPEMAKVWDKRGDIFLEGGVQSLAGGARAQVFRGGTRYLYYRGLRVFTLQTPSVFTWNILEAMQLTEDRTLAAQYLPAFYAARHVAQSADRDFIKDVLNAKEGTWEHGFDYSSISITPSSEFIELARIYGRRAMLGGFLRAYDPVTRVAEASIDWRKELLGVLAPKDLLQAVDWEDVDRLVRKHRTKLVDLLRRDYAAEHPDLSALETRGLAGMTGLAAATAAALGDADDDVAEMEEAHGTLQFAGTVTGRFSAETPNESNPPRVGDDDIPF